MTSTTLRKLAPQLARLSAQVIAVMDAQRSRDSELGHDEIRLCAQFVELARTMGATQSGAYHWAQIQLGDAQYTAALAALGRHDPRHTAINPRGWWNSWQDQWNAEGLPPLT